MTSRLICVPVTMYPKPPFKSKQHNCDDCGQSVWVSEKHNSYSRLVCLECFAEQVRPGDTILPPTKEELREIAAMKKERMQ